MSRLPAIVFSARFWLAIYLLFVIALGAIGFYASRQVEADQESALGDGLRPFPEECVPELYECLNP